MLLDMNYPNKKKKKKNNNNNNNNEVDNNKIKQFNKLIIRVLK